MTAPAHEKSSGVSSIELFFYLVCPARDRGHRDRAAVGVTQDM